MRAKIRPDELSNPRIEGYLPLPCLEDVNDR